MAPIKVFKSLLACGLPSLLLAQPPYVLSFFLASDTHLGHDVGNTTSLELNTNVVLEMNGLPGNATWPAAMGGGQVAEPTALVITGDLVDNGYNEWTQWANWTSLYGLTGKDGMLKYKVYEGRGNHDGGNSTDTEPHFVASSIIARNQLRMLDAQFNIVGVSKSGLHYAWQWPITPSCNLTIVMMNEYAGHICDGCSPDSCFYGPSCYAGWTYPEDSLGFLQEILPTAVGKTGQPVMVAQHYGFDGYSNSWYSDAQRAELYATLTQYNTVGIWVGHTHAAAVYQWNGTDTGDTVPGGLDVYNIPSTQKEDKNGNGLPSEFMAADITMQGATGNATLRVAQRVGFDTWGDVTAMKTFSCPGAA